MKYPKAFVRFWYDFVIGDDWKIAAGVLGAMALTLAATAVGFIPSGAAPVVGAVLVASAFTIGMVLDTRVRRRR